MSKKLDRIAILSIHTSPLHQPGFGDAGGMNVYVAETAKRIAGRGVEVEIFTRATTAADPEVVQLAPGVQVRHIPAGPFEGLSKEDLPAQLCAITAGLLRAEASKDLGFYDLIHSHYWLSGQVGWLAKERWNVPLVHTMHTMARVKNSSLAGGDSPEPAVREIGEEQVVAIADYLVANTDQEAKELIDLYHADPKRVAVINPGVDLTEFVPGDKSLARTKLGIAQSAKLILFVGRIQPLKGPDVLLRSIAELVQHNSDFASDLVVAICGGPSGTGLDQPNSLRELADELNIASLVKFVPPLNRQELVTWFQACDICAVPSYSESFGLVALEAQACGAPVIATKVGGLLTTVADEVSGILVSGHAPSDWASAILRILSNPYLAANLSQGAIGHAAKFDWDQTTDNLLNVYHRAVAGY
ncbi:MAG: D-inositol-3-phosphate glycosyltransferase [Actinobacteria bacterium]|nr:D-inositol-3-phosphate glycosyltransferase [Actinomycetota bacterium]NBY15423.1 D-inositol-3-phosphate glycosyltransferase [Actinomycetota bacterium]